MKFVHFFRNVFIAVALEGGFAAARVNDYHNSMNDMQASDGMNFAREAFLVNAGLQRALEALATCERVNDTRHVC